MSFDTAMPGGNVSLSPPSSDAATAGSGGHRLYLWELDTTTRVNYAIHVPASKVTNATDYPLFIPGLTFAGGTMPGGARALGAEAAGRLSDEEINSLDGSVTFADDDGTIIGSVAVNGEFKVGGPPSEGVASGSNVTDNPTYNAYIQPSSGLPRYIEDTPSAGFIDLRYTSITGTVTDSAGNSVPNSTVQVDGEGFTTDSSGNYNLLAPKDLSSTYTALKGTKTRNEVAETGKTVDFQFGGVSVKVSDPSDGSPYEGVPVEINGSQVLTGPDGIATNRQLGIGFHEVTIMDSYDVTVQVGFEGNHQTVGLDDVETSGAGFTGVKVRVRDAETGRPVEGTPTKIPGLGIRSATGPDGTGSVLHNYPEDGDDYEIVVADGDPRYNVAGLVRSPNSDEDTVLVQVEPAVPTVDM